ncbi:hypothetical protein EMIHUDRAFT_214532 [Emiliania huxleyi CCMP1516]|uniref:ATPase AAA-type core domain-containing protein n=2 Tax=Emiliania huxleyi TaxID=2903 RepID=A0A0D3IK69_EMIH1|nr:hypothetical protein EMIHUDRAFT_214532 [Emiliania huxleyi CCMP1516]EOD11654.1 hypothetical protein EMIHUDRAFT_214532 [Emiliania huxleyi CCMP1516]|eukprot:XP_005764083.1 hypothetical protein EMIHUDRAFT_214532 [Emiliania huxleyi CCMP1516]
MAVDCPSISNWLLQVQQAGGAPATSGATLLTGNASAHTEELRAQLRAAAATESDARYLLDPAAWHSFACSDGGVDGADSCATLVDDVAATLQQRAGMWTVVFVAAAELAPAAQIASIVGRFWRAARCIHSSATDRLDADCRRTLFVLSTRLGDEAAMETAAGLGGGGLAGGGLAGGGPEGEEGSAGTLSGVRLRERVARDAAAWLASGVCVAAAGASDRCAGDAGELSALDALEGVVAEVRSRLEAARVGASGGEDAHNYRTDEDLWKLVSPPCGIKGEGAFAALFAGAHGEGREKGEGRGARAASAPVGPVVVFDEIEEARRDFMTTALVNAIDHRGFVEHAPTAGAIFVLTSNCFLDELAEATRAEMERRIFTDAIPCSRADGTPSPFAAGKMRDRMRGNAFPFLPLSGEQMAAAFEMQLERRANHYEDENGVSLHWTRDFARLARGAAVGGESVRKRIDVLMRLDSHSVERLYASAASRCRPRRLEALILHTRAGTPAAEPICAGGDRAEGDAEEQRAAPTSAPPQRHHSLGESVPERVLDAEGEARLARLRLEGEAALAAARQAHRAEVEGLRRELAEAREVLWGWEMSRAWIGAAALASLAIALLSSSWLAWSATAWVIKAAAGSAVAVVVAGVAVAAVAALLCAAGSEAACELQRHVQAAARAAIALLLLGWQLLAWAAGALGALGWWGAAVLTAAALGLRFYRDARRRRATQRLAEDRAEVGHG